MYTATMDEFLTVEEFCTIYKISEPTVRRMIKKGEIKHIKIGKSIRILKDWRNIDENE